MLQAEEYVCEVDLPTRNGGAKRERERESRRRRSSMTQVPFQELPDTVSFGVDNQFQFKNDHVHEILELI
jgi:hypothetical protein